MDSPSSVNYPTMCSMTVNPTINANRFCVRSPGGCWSPLSPTVCVSSGINYPFEVTNPHRVAHSPLKLSNGSPVYSTETQARSYGQKQMRGCTVQASDTSLEMRPALLFENYAAHEDHRDIRTLTVDNRVKHLHANNVTRALEQKQNKMMTHHPGLLVPNTWAKLTPAPSTPPMRGVQSQLRRVAVSLETLNTNQENSGADSYNKLMQFTPTTDSLVLLQQSCSPCLGTSVCASHDEYQSLLMRDCQPHIVESQQTARNKQASGPRRPECPLSDSVCFSPSSPNNNRRTRNSQSVGACVQMPTLGTSCLNTIATENNVLSMANDTFTEQEKSPMSKVNTQSRKDVKLRWNLKARHKPTIALKSSQTRRTRQPFVTFESGGDAEGLDSTLARFVKSEITCSQWKPAITNNRKPIRSHDAKSVSQPTTPVKTATVQVQGSFV
ncbi:hypothetical protein PHET_01202 [Paragonimus heterotremus]|uniref:Uncharacterized protein n=1 Tax=Paragonimus heterotremus TaxID=100268 RepID=A0A8J4WUS0_9TREM|nr:hypothetical protein PHET_01202 [Paragonimus heterotremus]